MWEDEDEFACPSGLPPEELGGVLVRAHDEVGGGRQAAVELLRRRTGWLASMDAAGFIAIGAPSPRDPDQRPRAVVRWAEAVAATEYGGVLHDEVRHPGKDPRLLRIAAGLAGAGPVDLADVLSGLDHETTRYVLAAVESSTQAHVQYYSPRLPDGRDGFYGMGGVPMPRIVEWPLAEPSTWQQPELALWPARVAEEAAAAWAVANPEPEVSLPLAAEVVEVLRHLRRPGGMRGGGLGLWGRGAIAQELRRRTSRELADRLGLPVPELSALTEAGYRRECFSWEAGELPDRAVPLLREEEHRPVFVCWVPPGVSLDEVPFHQEVGSGVATLTIVVRRRDADHTDPGPTTDLHSAAGGRTLVRVGGHRVGIQRSGRTSTRLGWRRDLGDETAHLVLEVPLRPVEALDVLLRSGIPSARG
ncbi:hypothetical protein OG218_09625 [Kineococcus sp. NBC_00420]|uniref:hypothetical protein n=1 Tax=Kineococcus sp. NBC_00420 TaxID=2903564 RepID=UPI002E20C5E7